VRLVDIFRKYLQTGKGIQSFSKTTDDLALQVLNLNLTSDKYNELLQMLRLSDAVKYAKFTPASEENDHALETIRKTIDAIERR
jgi:predicted ArsR family transcriptional regulator